jgi:hypothetical protein
VKVWVSGTKKKKINILKIGGRFENELLISLFYLTFAFSEIRIKKCSPNSGTGDNGNSPIIVFKKQWIQGVAI